MTLSAYELERQRNIERNQEVLRSLGLVGDGKLIPDPPPKPKPQRVSVKADACVELPSRRSDRVKHKPAMFDGLTDDFFRAEHCDSDDSDSRTTRPSSGRPKRDVKGITRFEQEFEQHAPRPPKRPVAHTWPVFVPNERTKVPKATHAGVTGLAVVPFGMPQPLPLNTVVKGSRSDKITCPLCNFPFSLRSDGVTLQKHAPCGSVRVSFPVTTTSGM